MVITEKDRKLIKNEAVKRLEYLVSWGLNSDMLKKFKSLGRVYVNEVITSDWADRNGKTNCKFPRTYVFTDTVPEITEEMLATKQKLESEGYLVYLITREKRNSPKKENCTDKVEYFIIDNIKNKSLYTVQDSEFREGFAKVYNQNITANSEGMGYTYYKVRLEQVILDTDKLNNEEEE